MSVLEAYYKGTERSVAAPSGLIYRVRGVSVGQYGKALGGLPILASPNDSKADAEKPNQVEAYLSFQRAICAAGTISVSYLGQDGEPGDVELWPAGDVAAVFLAIQEASGLLGDKADDARRSV